MDANCESCTYYEYDDEYDEYFCSVYLDEDDMDRLSRSRTRTCPFYRDGDEYLVVRKQM